MKLYVIFPENVDDFMPVNDQLIPAKIFNSLGAIVSKQEAFFSSIASNVKKEDYILVYPTLHKKWREQFKKINCTKILRNIDPAKSDGILYRTDLELHEEIGGFDRWFVGVPSEKNLNFLRNKGLRVDPFTHCLDFNGMISPDEARQTKNYDVILSGQQHEKFYPDRWRLMNYFLGGQKKYKTLFLPHPGFEISKRRHEYIGENYVKLLHNFWAGPVGVGHADGLHMKFLEMAKAYVLPLGSVPTYMIVEAAKEICQVGMSETDEQMEKIISDLFLDKEALWQRIVSYSSIIKSHYDANMVIKEIYRSIMQNKSIKD